MSSPKNQRDFFKFVIHVINASIIAYSFNIVYNSHFIPFGLIQSLDDAVNFLAMVFVWGVMISGWLGYTKSINDKPHSEGNLGNLRFVIDLIISFLMLYLFIITGKDYFNTNFGEVFTFVLPAIFRLYVIWDFIKNREYPTTNADKHNVLQLRQMITVIAFFVLVAQSFVFIIYERTYYSESFIPDNNFKYYLFMAFSTIIIGSYRIAKGRLYRGLDS